MTVWQEHWDNLTRVLSQPSSQSWLFWGEKNTDTVSQTTEQALFAEKLIAWLLCDHHTPQAACGVCTPCQWLSANTHPDYLKISLTPSETSINVETIRQIKAFSEKMRHHGMHRIILILPAEAMNISAANALLKILEEPFDNTLFFLVSSRISWLLPTIRSRCQKLYFPSNNESNLPNAFKEGLFTLMDSVMNSEKKQPLEIVDKIKVLEKTVHASFEDTIDTLLLYTYQKIISNQNKKGYLLYDKLIEIKRCLKMGINMNQTIWLEDCFSREL